MRRYFLGVEIGGTKQQLAVGDDEGRLIRTISEKVKLDRGALSIRDWLEAQVERLKKEFCTGSGSIVSACIGFGGPLQSSNGRILTSVHVEGWKDFRLKDWFEGRFGLPAIVINDTVAGGYGELYRGSGKNSRNFLYSNIGSGIGGSIFLERNYYDGLGFGAAYIGNTYIPDWTVPESGKETRVECICSGLSIEHRLRRPGYVPQGSKIMELAGNKAGEIDCRILGEAAKAGDRFALGEIERIARSYGTGLGNAITLLSPDTVAIGGGVSNIGEPLIEAIRRHTADHVFISAKDRYKIVQSKLGDDVVLVGALLWAVHMDKKLDHSTEMTAAK